MDVGKIIRLVAVIFAVVAGLVTVPQEALIIAVLGLVGGWFVEEDNAMRFLVAAVALYMVNDAEALNAIPKVGEYLMAILASLSALFNAAACTVIVMGTYNRLKP